MSNSQELLALMIISFLLITVISGGGVTLSKEKRCFWGSNRATLILDKSFLWKIVNVGKTVVTLTLERISVWDRLNGFFCFQGLSFR